MVQSGTQEQETDREKGVGKLMLAVNFDVGKLRLPMKEVLIFVYSSG
jgi:hypothetical protein